MCPRSTTLLAIIDTLNVTIASHTVTTRHSKSRPARGSVSDAEFDPGTPAREQRGRDDVRRASAAVVSAPGNCLRRCLQLGRLQHAPTTRPGAERPARPERASTRLTRGFAEHGGPTQPRAIGKDSPAFDYVPTATARVSRPGGVSRPHIAQCDSGAFEFRASVADLPRLRLSAGGRPPSSRT